VGLLLLPFPGERTSPPSLALTFSSPPPLQKKKSRAVPEKKSPPLPHLVYRLVFFLARSEKASIFLEILVLSKTTMKTLKTRSKWPFSPCPQRGTRILSPPHRGRELFRSIRRDLSKELFRSSFGRREYPPLKKSSSPPPPSRKRSKFLFHPLDHGAAMRGVSLSQNFPSFFPPLLKEAPPGDISLFVIGFLST